MSSASVSSHGFAPVRGRGYRPEEVDAYIEALSEDRDAAWERAARLTVLAREMEEELEDLRETLAELPPQTYESLGEGARLLFQAAQDEAAAVRERARRETREQVAEAEAYADRVRRTAREEADALVAEVEERARQRVLAASTEADEIRIEARREVKEGRAEALSALRELRHRTAAMLAEQEKAQAERWSAVENQAVEGDAVVDAGLAERVARAEAELAEAERDFADAEQAPGREQEKAQALAAEVLAQARAREDQIARETERVLREHGERWDDVQAHMDYVRNSLAALTGGRAPAE
ncbi:DivIVA domain-containing protein [Streptomyces sp. NPDC089424]|uniref:DivIVA domain-containing protein n=1 Tax=Streptomyces sp. NPDC089424 TaxID=3365917 RepID=UPI003828AA48